MERYRLLALRVKIVYDFNSFNFNEQTLSNGIGLATARISIGFDSGFRSC